MNAYPHLVFSVANKFVTCTGVVGFGNDEKRKVRSYPTKLYVFTTVKKLQYFTSENIKCTLQFINIFL